jgi:hypothetical protein
MPYLFRSVDPILKFKLRLKTSQTEGYNEQCILTQVGRRDRDDLSAQWDVRGSLSVHSLQHLLGQG